MGPSTRPANKIEAKYHVTTEYPDLGLHSAAVSGNVGLAHFALTHGQPENSVLHGLLPLHAASSGGSEPIVRMLLERGADVNAPRLPRRYSSGGHGAPAVGVSGSAPLHFAAANGHHAIVKLLLAKGAIPDKRDKHGLMPEDLALANGFEDIFETLRAFSALRASLRARDGSGEDSSDGAGNANGRASMERAVADDDEDDEHGSLAPLRSNSSGAGRRLGVRKSFDSLLRSRKPSNSSIASTTSSQAPPSSSDHSSTINGGGTSSRRSFHSTSATPNDSSSSLLFTLDSASSSSRRLATDAPPLTIPPHVLPDVRNRRPSLPSILERAAHQIAHPRTHSSSHHPPPVRGPTMARTPTINSMDTDAGSVASSKLFTSSKSLKKLFSGRATRRGGDGSPSPPSASPSPPASIALPPLPDDEDVDRAFEELGLRSSQPRRTVSDSSARHTPPPSAPATRSTFFDPDGFAGSSLSLHPSHSYSSLLDDDIHALGSNGSGSHSTVPSPDLSDYGGGPDGQFWRPRLGSEVVMPSPLGLQWSGGDGRRRLSHRAEDRPRFYDRQPSMDLSDGEDSSAGSRPVPSRQYSSASSMSGRHRSSSDPPRNLPYSPVSAHSSSFRHSSYRAAGLSAVPPARRTYAVPILPGSLKRASSMTSSTGSSLRKVASANLRRGESQRGDGQDPYDAPPMSARSAGNGWRRGGGQDEGYDPRPPRLEVSGPPGRLGPGRSRGQSFTSIGSSALSISPTTSPALTPPHSTDDHDQGYAEGDSSPRVRAEATVGPAILVSTAGSPPPSSFVGGRARGISVSTVASSNGTSYTSPSLHSSGAQSTSSGGIPTIPEGHSLPHHGSALSVPRSISPSSGSHPLKRRVSTREEARESVRQAERDILESPYLSSTAASSSGGNPSSLSLSARLAAYSDSLAVEREFASRERSSSPGDSQGSSRLMARGASNGSGVPPAQRSARGAGVPERLNPVGLGTAPGSILDRSSMGPPTAMKSSSSGFGKHISEKISSSRSRGAPAPLVTIEAPPSQAKSLPGVSKIYADRAEAMRKRGVAVTSAVSSSRLADSPPSKILPSWATSGPSSRKASAPLEEPNVMTTPTKDKLWIISGHGRSSSTPAGEAAAPSSSILASTSADRDSTPKRKDSADASKADVKSIRSTSSSVKRAGGSSKPPRRSSTDSHAVDPASPSNAHRRSSVPTTTTIASSPSSSSTKPHVSSRLAARSPRVATSGLLPVPSSSTSTVDRSGSPARKGRSSSSSSTNNLSSLPPSSAPLLTSPSPSAPSAFAPASLPSGSGPSRRIPSPRGSISGPASASHRSASPLSSTSSKIEVLRTARATGDLPRTAADKDDVVGHSLGTLGTTGLGEPQQAQGKKKWTAMFKRHGNASAA